MIIYYTVLQILLHGDMNTACEFLSKFTKLALLLIIVY